MSVIYWDQHVKRSRLLHADPDSLEYTPGWWDRHIDELVDGRGANIVLWGDPSSGLLDDVDPPVVVLVQSRCSAARPWRG